MPSKPIEWHKPSVIGLQMDPQHLPTPRSGYTLTFLGVNGYLFGGLDAGAVPPAASDGLYVVRMSEEVCEWKRMEQPAAEAWPLPRWRHTAVTHAGAAAGWGDAFRVA